VPVILIETRIRAPIARVFDLARDVDVHAQTSAFTGERIVGGRTSGLLQLGDMVVFEAVHLGLRRRLTAKIVELDPPHRFIDEMVEGPFASLRHLHEFRQEGSEVVMRDTLTWQSPLGLLGRLADFVLVHRHLRAYLTTKQTNPKAHAEREPTPFADRSSSGPHDLG
jgi:ligand-binding SRPBCC domain-containing protein